MMMDLSGGRFKYARHLDMISRTIRDRLVRGNARLIITVPPRHGKSWLCSVYTPLWLFSMRPQTSVFVVSYGIRFSRKWGRRMRAVLRAYQDDLEVHLDPAKEAAEEFDLLEGGEMFCTGVGGELIGRGADLIIVDDPHKDRKEVESEVMRENVTEWWQGTARDRLEPGGSVILIMQRWREDDLAGFLLSDESGEEWELINFPCQAEEADALGRVEGEWLWPERFTPEEYEALRKTVNSYNWASKFQQRPAPAGGSVFKAEHFRYFRETETHYVLERPDMKPKHVSKEACARYQTCDTALTAKTMSDWTVCLTYVVTPKDGILVLEVARERLEVPEQFGWLMAQRAKWSPVWQGVEEAGSGHGLIAQGRDESAPFKRLKADKDKVLRAEQASVMYENGMVYHRAGAHWLADYEGELLSFPNGTHDDQVDCVAYAAREVSVPPMEVVWL